MQKDNKFLDDMAKLATGAAGSMLEMKREMESMMRLQAEKLLQNMDLATSEEVETLRRMLAKCREEQEKLENRVKVLENALKMHENAPKPHKNQP